MKSQSAEEKAAVKATRKLTRKAERASRQMTRRAAQRAAQEEKAAKRRARATAKERADSLLAPPIPPKDAVTDSAWIDSENESENESKSTRANSSLGTVSAADTSTSESRWYRLDNVAKLFPAVSSKSNSSVFRVSAVVSERIDPSTLQRCLDALVPSFPMLFVTLRNGVFWNYMDDSTPQNLRVRKESLFPCAPLVAQHNQGYLMRVLYFEHRLSVEFFHTLTDGTGAFEFLKALAFDYLVARGLVESGSREGILEEQPPFDFLEEGDAYERIARIARDSRVWPSSQAEAQTLSQKQPDAFRIKGKTLGGHGIGIIDATMSANSLHRLAAAEGVTITAYLSALLITAIHAADAIGNDVRPVIVTVPVNLRKAFKIATLRNLFSVVNISEPSGEGDQSGTRSDHDFRKLLPGLSEQLRAATTPESLAREVAKNMALERNPFSRVVPLPVKRLFILFGFDVFGESKKTITLSNVGKVTLPSSMEPFVDHMEMHNYTTRRNPMTCTVATVGDRLCISFTRALASTAVPRAFLKLLAAQGIEITVAGNGM